MKKTAVLLITCLELAGCSKIEDVKDNILGNNDTTSVSQFETVEKEKVTKPESDGENRYFFNGRNYMYKAGNGFASNDSISGDDIHMGWELGEFIVSGFTSYISENDGKITFLKNVGDNISVDFNLLQNIDRLNGDDTLSINDDSDGYDSIYGVAKSENGFGRGTLIVSYTDYENYTNEPVVYKDYLKGAENGANIKVDTLGEGDYCVALDYEICNSDGMAFVLPTYTNYKISISFSVRNSNCMIYPFEKDSGLEMKNQSFTEKGFYLDLANSRYLDIIVKKLNVSPDNGFAEDTRFNRAAKDKEVFDEEGVYVISVKNRYTGESTEKKIYVGNNNVLKAYVSSGLPYEKILAYIDEGAIIDDNGKIIKDGNDVMSKFETSEENENVGSKKGGLLKYFIIGGGVFLVLLVLLRKMK